MRATDDEQTLAVDRLVAERSARRGDGNLLEVLEELPEPVAGHPTTEVLEDVRADRV